MKHLYIRSVFVAAVVVAAAAQLGTIVWGNHIIWGD